ncbi:PAS domain-containing protein [Mobilitalea sibirica]|uniref:PAS domain-containing protein n=1 Tax=Mobilitalea sibirica TaxID=1462919 RepID=A0A8J7H1G4_9FIRM|nr:PAS domain-containing protein [Mobilitalea sibirica]MBH1940259.1 PAS domain-containing protein [Mobilitalea sibirica]
MMKKNKSEIKMDQYMKEFFDLIPIGMVIVDSDTRIKAVNRTIIDMMGGDGIVELGKRFGDGFRCVESLIGGCGSGKACIMCEIRGTIMKAIKTRHTYNNIVLKHEFIVNDKEVSPWYKMSFVPLNIQGKDHVMMTVDDVTDLKI